MSLRHNESVSDRLNEQTMLRLLFAPLVLNENNPRHHKVNKYELGAGTRSGN